MFPFHSLVLIAPLTLVLLSFHLLFAFVPVSLLRSIRLLWIYFLPLCFSFPVPNFGEKSCAGCSRGKYKSKTACIDCAAGQYADTIDMQECNDCPKGFFAKNFTTITDESKRRHDSCSACPRGRYGENYKATDQASGCKRCVAGRYSDGEGLAKDSDTVMCIPCIPGRYSTEEGNAKDSKCLNCVSGTWSSLAGVSSLTDCQLCGVGRFSAGVGVATEASCKICPLGFEQIETGKAYCLPCTPGRFGKVNEEFN